MAIEEFTGQPMENMSAAQIEQFVGDLRGRFPSDDCDLDDDDLAAFVRKLGPRSPRGHSGALVKPPEEPSFD